MSLTRTAFLRIWYITPDYNKPAHGITLLIEMLGESVQMRRLTRVFTARTHKV